MARILLVTNDFPPRVGGIQSYLRDFVATLNPDDIIVYASTQNAEEAARFDAAQPYQVVRYPRAMMLPTPDVRANMVRLIKQHNITTVWFGAAAPLGLLAPAARKAGARHIVATTHGHEVGWAMLPGARQLLRRIGHNVDVVTYISQYTLGRIRRAFDAPSYAHLPSGVDNAFFHPLDPARRAEVRAQWQMDRPTIVCVSRLVPRKGQDMLIRALPRVQQRIDAQLLIVGAGRYERRLRKLAERTCAPGDVRFLGSLPREQMRDVLAASDVYAMPCRTRGFGLDVEGLGIVYLEAQACGVSVVAGDSGGAPETVKSDCGIVVPGRDTVALSNALLTLLEHPCHGGVEHVKEWTWEIMGARLANILKGS